MGCSTLLIIIIIVKELMSKKKRDETLDKIKCISEIVAEVVKLYDRDEKINLAKVLLSNQTYSIAQVGLLQEEQALLSSQNC